MGFYETLCIMSPNLGDAEVENVVQRLKDVVARSDGQVHQIENWGRRKPAYEVKKHRKGIYVLMYLSGPGKMVAELERHCRLMDPVLKYLTVKLEKLPEVPPPQEEAASQEAQSTGAEQPAQPGPSPEAGSTGEPETSKPTKPTDDSPQPADAVTTEGSS